MYVSDGYFGVGEGHRRNPPPGTHKGDLWHAANTRSPLESALCCFFRNYQKAQQTCLTNSCKNQHRADSKGDPILAVTDPRILCKNTRCAWAGGTFFPVVLSCQFLVLAGNRFWFTYLCTWSTIQLWCCVSFLVLAGNSFWYVRSPYSCGVVLVFLVLAGNSFWCYVHT